MNSNTPIPTPADAAAHRVEFFRLPAPGKRDPFFGLSRGWYYKAAAHGEIKMIALRQRNALRGVRLVVYDFRVRLHPAGRESGPSHSWGGAGVLTLTPVNNLH
ncbi:MAG TPA: hypothetical protein VNW30_07480 [Opitutaceae bacterium]|nr:hypothetical protein [Opitutaceae bacterium]